MPWSVVKGGGTCEASQYAVIKDSDGSTAGCHGTEGEAQAQLAALYASEKGSVMSDERARAAEARRAAMTAPHSGPWTSELPAGAQGRSGPNLEKPYPYHDRVLAFPAQFRTETAERDGKSFFQIQGYASVFEQPYEMWDQHGPYDEVVSKSAADDTLAAKPDVAFLINHRGLSLARTAGPWNGDHGTLELEADDHGLANVAWLNPERTEVKNLRLAIDDLIVTEQSFAFQIDDGEWSDDFTTYRINRFNLHRGDVSAVNYGANPYTSIAARQQEILTDLRLAGPGMARAAFATLAGRSDVDIDELARRYLDGSRKIVVERDAYWEAAVEAKSGRSLDYWERALADE